MLTRRSILRGLLAGAVSAVARVSPLVVAPAAPTMIDIVKRTMWYSDHTGPLSNAQAAKIVEQMSVAMQRIQNAKAYSQAVIYLSKPNPLLDEIAWRSGVATHTYNPETNPPAIE